MKAKRTSVRYDVYVGSVYIYDCEGWLNEGMWVYEIIKESENMKDKRMWVGRMTECNSVDGYVLKWESINEGDNVYMNVIVGHNMLKKLSLLN